MSLISGVAVRPQGSDSYWPPIGTRVPFTVTQPIQDLVDQGKAAGLENLGTIGNTMHLQRHGDHTPWSAGKARGRLYAKDTHVPAGFKAWLLTMFRQPDYDTRWVDFINIEGGQYDGAGNYLGASGDYHLHVSVNKGYENAHVTLFRDWQHRNDKPAAAPVGAGTFVAAYNRRTTSKAFPLYGKPVTAAAGRPKYEGVLGDVGLKGLTMDARTLSATTLLDWFGSADPYGGRSIQTGLRNDGVRLVEALVNTGMDPRDGAYGPGLAMIVASLQKAWGLKVHGRVDHATLVAFGLRP